MMHKNAVNEVVRTIARPRADVITNDPDLIGRRSGNRLRGVDIELVDDLLQDLHGARPAGRAKSCSPAGEAPSEDVFVADAGGVSVYLAGTESPSHTVIDAGSVSGRCPRSTANPTRRR